jgi:hypothetical protein
MRRACLAAAVLGAAAALAPVTPAHAATELWGFAYVEDPAPPAVYVPDPSRQATSVGSTVQAGPDGGTGAYRVYFPGLAAGNLVAHVTAVTRTGEWCQVNDLLTSGSTEIVRVRCFRPGGAPAASRFSVLLSAAPAAAAPGAYAFVRVAPSGGLLGSYNSLGAANSVSPLGGGDYVVTLPGVGADPSSVLTGGVQVTASNGTVPARCKVRGWATGPGGQQVAVRCVDPGGLGTPTGFALSYQHKRSIVGRTPPGRFGYVFDLGGGPQTVYNSAGGAVTTGAGGTGLRAVQFTGIGVTPDTMQATAYGPGPEYCTFAQPWLTSGGTVTLRYVVCYSNTGVLTTQPSLVTYTSRV